MRHERAVVQGIRHWRAGHRRGLTFADAELAAIARPTLLVDRTADPAGTVDTWRRAAELLARGGDCHGGFLEFVTKWGAAGRSGRH